MKLIICKVILLFFVLNPVFAQQTYTYSKPKEFKDGWKTESLASQKVDSTLFYRLFNQLNGADHQLHSFLLVKNGKLILEEYFGGYNAEKIHDLRSTSKSIRALLLGIAIDKGFIESVHDPIFKYLKHIAPKKNLDERKNQITIEHLITMSTGLDCNDFDKKSKGQEDRVYKKKDWLQYTLDLPVLHNPGEVSNYCSMGVILTTEIIEQASGMPIDKFADKYLFEPLNIQNIKWGHTKNKEVISSGKRLYMTPRDMAKIGKLVLQKGNWNGTQIISEKWIEEATTPKTKITAIDYGYLWWNIPFPFHGKKLLSKTATGNGGQYIIIFSELDLVIVFTGGAYNSPEAQLPFKIVKDIVLPSIKN